MGTKLYFYTVHCSYRLMNVEFSLYYRFVGVNHFNSIVAVFHCFKSTLLTVKTHFHSGLVHLGLTRLKC